MKTKYVDSIFLLSTDNLEMHVGSEKNIFLKTNAVPSTNCTTKMSVIDF